MTSHPLLPCCRDTLLAPPPGVTARQWAARLDVWVKAHEMWQHQRSHRKGAETKAAEEAATRQRAQAQQEMHHIEEWGRRIVAEGDALMQEEEEEAEKGRAAANAVLQKASKVRSVSAVHQQKTVVVIPATHTANTDGPACATKVTRESTEDKNRRLGEGLEDLWCGCSLAMQRSHLDASTHVAAGKFLPALLLYDKIVEGLRQEESPALSTAYSNRAFILYRLDRYTECVTEALRATEVDTNNLHAYAHAARAYVMLSNVRSARMMYTYLQSVLHPGATWLRVEVTAIDEIEQLGKAFHEAKFAEAKRCAERVATALGTTAATEGWRIECLIHLRPDDAGEEIQTMTSTFGDHSIALYLRAKSMFYTGTDPITTSTASQYVARALATSNNCERAKPLEIIIRKFEQLRNELQSHTIHKRWQRCADACTSILSLDERNLRLMQFGYVQRGTAYAKLGSHVAAVADYTRALDEEDTRSAHDVLLLRGESYAHMQRYAEAIRDFEEAYRAAPSISTFEKLEKVRKECNAQRQARQGPQRPRASSTTAAVMRRTLYDVLGASRDANVIQLNKCFRDAALRWHPDRWSGCAEEQQRHAEGIFKQVNNAYCVLIDEDARRKYDAGLV